MILIVNGINTAKGGSGSHLLNIWTSSLERRGKRHQVLGTVPTWPNVHSAVLRSCLLALYFLPGTLLRVFRLPMFELAYKISPFLICKFLLAVKRHEPEHVLFSHHAVFYLSFFYRREGVHYIVHDLLYRRSRSLGFGRRLSKFVFWVECHVYRRAASLVCLSCQEERILRRFCFQRVKLLSSYATESEIYPPANYDFRHIAVVSDWRRPENVHGVKTFFQQSSSNGGVIEEPMIHLYIYGFESAEGRDMLAGLPGADEKFNVTARGFYKDQSTISEGVFLVPIYQGAGIKIKVLEALKHRRYVLGTPGAFEGLQRRWLTGVATIVNSMSDLPKAEIEVDPQAFARFEARYSEKFNELGNIDFGGRTGEHPRPE